MAGLTWGGIKQSVQRRSLASRLYEDMMKRQTWAAAKPVNPTQGAPSAEANAAGVNAALMKLRKR